MLRVPAVSSFNRPANVTAYATGQLVANNTVAGSVVPLQFLVGQQSVLEGNPFVRGYVSRARFQSSSAVVTAATFNLHLFNALPTVGAGDGAALNIATGLPNFMGTIACDLSAGAFLAGGGKVKYFAVNPTLLGFDKNITSDPNLYALIEATAAYAPASSELITVGIEVVLDSRLD